MKRLKLLPIIFILVFTFYVLPVFASAEVPFAVFKTYVTAEGTDTSFSGTEAIAIDGVLYDDASEGEKFGYPPPKGEYDKRVKIPVESVHYKMEFWNVGKMGGEKSFVFNSSYEKAKLTRTYELGQAYQNVPGKEEFMGIKSMETKAVTTPNVDTTFITDLTFTGGPYGKFYYTDSKGIMWPIAHISNGKEIVFDNVPENTDPKKPRYLMTLGYAQSVYPQITNSSAFEKWMEILNQQPGCDDPNDPKTDSGIRFSDYSGEVMVRPCDDDDAWYGAELDMVLHRNDHIRTGDDSSCVLSLPDLTTFIMKPESELILSSAPTKENKILLIWGKIKANVKRMMKDGTMNVEMSQAVAGIKGTIFTVEETGTESTLKVIEGMVDYTSKSTGDTESIGTGKMITATKNGLGEKQTFNIEDEIASWENMNATGSQGFVYLLALVLIVITGGTLLYVKKFKK